MIKTLKQVFLLLFMLAPLTNFAEAQLLGDWAGMRKNLDQHGVSADAVLTTDLLYNAAGGLSQAGTILGNFDLTFELDTQQANWWENGTFFVYFLGNFNSNGFMTDIVGDLQTSSNIEADETFRIFEFWYEHRFAADRFSVLIGLHDFNSEFDTLEYGGLFINSSFGISPDISQNGPSIFPSAALGLRGKFEFEHAYIMGTIYDGVPDDSGDAPRTTVSLKEQDGIFAALELGMKEGSPDQANYYKLALGAWVHTAEVENFNGQVHNYNRGFYLIGEKRLYAEAAEGQGLGAFIQLGMADKDLNQITTYWGFGLHYTGLIAGRDNDILGLAVAQALIGKEYLTHSKDVLGVDVEHNETALELTYRSEINPTLALQPNVQYIINPSMDPAIDNALQLGIRVELTF